MERKTKKEIYAEYDIVFDRKAGKILSPIGWIKPLLIKGNKKIGKVWHLSTLAGDKEYTANVNGEKVHVFGTCAGTCEKGYCIRGRYVFQSVIDALAIRTIIAREYNDFFYRAIMAQLAADKIKICRIHVTGDFFSMEYLNTWRKIIRNYSGVQFWTYTKEDNAKHGFDGLDNANIVESNVLDMGYNFGHIDYLIAIYNMLRDLGKPVYICRCGVDNDQHCDKCTACAKCKNVLFIEHSTEYNAKEDPRYPEIVDIINSQGNMYLI